MQDEVYIIGGGPSLRGFDFSLLKDKKIIATNAAIFDTPWADYFITIDATFQNKIGNRLDIIKSSKAIKLFIANFANPYIISRNGKIVDTRFDMTYDLKLFDDVIKSHRFDGFGYAFSDFRNGANSGYCALQLAIIIGYKRINLLGIDLSTDRETHYHNVYSGIKTGFMDKFRNYWIDGITKLRQERPNIEIVSYSPVSPLNKLISFNDLSDLRP